MKNFVGIWVDIDQAVIINLERPIPEIKKIESKINSKNNLAISSKKIIRFNGHYLTIEKFKESFQIKQTQQFINHLINELTSFESMVLFGPSNFKYLVQEHLQKDIETPPKINGVFNTELLSEGEMISWVENYYNN